MSAPTIREFAHNGLGVMVSDGETMDRNDLIGRDKQIERAVRAWRNWRLRLRSAPTLAMQDNPLTEFRSLSTRAALLEVRNLPEQVPTRDATMRWMAALTLDRVTCEDVAETERAFRGVRHTVRGLGARQRDVQSMCLEAVIDPEAGRRDLAALTLASVAEEASNCALDWMERRHEAARQLGIGSDKWLEVALGEDTTVQAVASQLVDASEELAAQCLPSRVPWQEVLAAGTASEAVEGWPAQLTWRWLSDVFRSELAGLELRLDRLPAARCGASFSHALERFGMAWHAAAARRIAGSFVLAERPFDLLCMSTGALFASLLASPAFCRRRLGLGQARARDQSRVFARSMVAAARVRAIQAAVSACDDAEQARRTHVELGFRALRTDLPEELVGVLPRYCPEATARMLGALHAARVRSRLVETFDEDWFDNPRAQDYMRNIDVTSRCIMNAADALEGTKSLVRLATEALA